MGNGDGVENKAGTSPASQAHSGSGEGSGTAANHIPVGSAANQQIQGS